VEKPWPWILPRDGPSGHALQWWGLQDLPISANPLTYFYFCMTGKLNHKHGRPHIPFPPYTTVPKNRVLLHKAETGLSSPARYTSHYILGRMEELCLLLAQTGEVGNKLVLIQL